ncbi:hypothetical protein BDP27DRAFT_1031091 [Rhodocollybia butyracea]|uniref:F-box domain-containing protein n=1 Tax=Rhodocollybia butyracea TaxID=206335 RepID=A0A9P5UEL6_9AGAR|nr:hypothetical protein BDP27DRAFT_1031091 [Rhodocollybia butyracea]
MDNLPIEIVEEILTKCSKHTLTHASQANKVWCAFSERILYTDIRLHSAGSTGMVTLRRCLQTLSKNRDKAAHIKSFDLYIFAALKEPDQSCLFSALVGMRNLKRLSLDIESFHENTLANTVGIALRMSTFSLTALRISSIIECDDWIASQSELKTLVIFHHESSWEPEAQDLGKWASQSHSAENISFVTSIRGWPSDLIALPGINSRSSECGWNAKDVIRLFAFSQFISTFYLFASSLLHNPRNIGICTQVSETFPEILTLVLAVKDTELEQVGDEITAIITPFLKLKYLRIRPWESQRCGSGMDNKHKYHLAQQWISQSETLQSVIFPDMTMICRSG